MHTPTLLDHGRPEDLAHVPSRAADSACQTGLRLRCDTGLANSTRTLARPMHPPPLPVSRVRKCYPERAQVSTSAHFPRAPYFTIPVAENSPLLSPGDDVEVVVGEFKGAGILCRPLTRDGHLVYPVTGWHTGSSDGTPVYSLYYIGLPGRNTRTLRNTTTSYWLITGVASHALGSAPQPVRTIRHARSQGTSTIVIADVGGL
jgi:hypothetical protein